MSQGISIWETFRVVKNYQQLPYDLTLALNTNTLRVRVQLSGGDITMSRDVGNLPADTRLAGLALVGALRNREVRLGASMEAAVRTKAFELVRLMDGGVATADPLSEDVLMPFFNRLADNALLQTYQAFEAVGRDRHQPSAPQMK